MTDRLVAMGFPNMDMRAHAYTVDGDSLTPLPGFRAYAHPAGIWGTRDPSLARVGGRYVMASTRALLANYLGPNDSLSLAAGDTLTGLRHVRDLHSGVPGTTRCWAPEIFTDSNGDVYLYYSVSTEPNPWDDNVIGFNIYARRLNPITLEPLDPPVKMEGLTGGLTPRVIDAQVTKIGHRYCMFVKNEQRMQIMRAWADSPLGPWLYDQWDNWLGIDGPVEGPQLVKLPHGWRLYYDRYTAPNGGQLAFKDSPDLNRWTHEVPLDYVVRDLRHPGYLWLTAGEWVAFRTQPRHVTTWTDRPQTFPTGSARPLAFHASVDDPHMWYPDRPTRLIADEPATYTLTFEVVWRANPAGQRSLVYRVNDQPWRWVASQNATGNGVGTEQTVSIGGVTLGRGSTVEIGAYQNSGGDVDIISAAATLTKR